MKRKMASKGFTLIELLVVMGLMALLTAMIFSNSFGMSQAASYAAAQEAVYNTLQMARQRACIDGKDVYVIIQNEKDKPHQLAIIEGYGRISVEYQHGTHPDSKIEADGFIVDNEYSLQRPSKTAKVEIYNFSSLAKAQLVAVRDEDENDFIPEIDISNHKREVLEEKQFKHHIRQLWLAPAKEGTRTLPLQANDWQFGTTYGFSVLPPQKIPKGFELSLDNGDTICFYSDGTSGVCNFKNGHNGDRNSTTATLLVTEKIARKSSKPIKIVVKSGNVTVEESAKTRK